MNHYMYRNIVPQGMGYRRRIRFLVATYVHYWETRNNSK